MQCVATVLNNIYLKTAFKMMFLKVCFP